MLFSSSAIPAQTWPSIKRHFFYILTTMFSVTEGHPNKDRPRKSCGPTRLKWDSLATICKGMLGEEKCYTCGTISHASGLCGSHWHRKESMKKTKSRKKLKFKRRFSNNILQLLQLDNDPKLKILVGVSQEVQAEGFIMALTVS